MRTVEEIFGIFADVVFNRLHFSAETWFCIVSKYYSYFLYKNILSEKSSGEYIFSKPFKMIAGLLDITVMIFPLFFYNAFNKFFLKGPTAQHHISCVSFIVCFWKVVCTGFKNEDSSILLFPPFFSFFFNYKRKFTWKIRAAEVSCGRSGPWKQVTDAKEGPWESGERGRENRPGGKGWGRRGWAVLHRESRPRRSNKYLMRC